MKQDMKDEFGYLVCRDWEAYTRKLDKEIKVRRKKLDKSIKLIVKCDPGQRDVLRKEMEQLRFEILNLVLEHYMAISPTIAYLFNKANNMSLN